MYEKEFRCERQQTYELSQPIRFKLAKIMCFGQYVMNNVSLGNKSWY